MGLFIMLFDLNAIALADRLRSPDDQVSFLQEHRILQHAYTCPDCDLTTEEAWYMVPGIGISTVLAATRRLA